MMTEIITLDQIKAVLPDLDLIPAIEEGFVCYSEGRAVVPPVSSSKYDGSELKFGGDTAGNPLQEA